MPKVYDFNTYTLQATRDHKVPVIDICGGCDHAWTIHYRGFCAGLKTNYDLNILETCKCQEWGSIDGKNG